MKTLLILFVLLFSSFLGAEESLVLNGGQNHICKSDTKKTIFETNSFGNKKLLKLLDNKGKLVKLELNEGSNKFELNEGSNYFNYPNEGICQTYNYTCGCSMHCFVDAENPPFWKIEFNQDTLKYKLFNQGLLKIEDNPYQLLETGSCKLLD